MIICFLISSCTKTENKSQISKKSKDRSYLLEEKDESKARLDGLVKSEEEVIEERKKLTRIELDAVNGLDSIECEEIQQIMNYKVTLDTLRKYKSSLKLIENEVDGIFKKRGLKYCFREIKETENYKLYILLTEIESHYTEIANLVSISKGKNEVNILEIAYEYLSEQEEYFMSSKFRDYDDIEVEKVIKYNYIHGIGAVDSIRKEITNYKIENSGEFTKNEN